MKWKEHTFKNPVTVLQIFRNIYEYGKDQKSFEDRKNLAQWRHISSKSGYVLDNQLYLPENIMEDNHFSNCTLLTIEDSNSTFHHTLQHIFPKKLNQCFQQARHIKLDIFKLEIGTQIEMYMQYGYFEIGAPQRPEFKLCELQPHKAVEIKINGKTDASASSRRGRTFKEQHYIYEMLGQFNQCFFLKEPFDPTIKTVPQASHTIDLMKPLW